MIRGGREFRLGIYVTGVERGSAAAAASLRAGDEIVRVNGRDCHRMGHEEAVHALRFSRSLSMVVRDVGKVPVGNSAGGGGGTGAASAAEAMFAGSNNNGCADINSRYGGNMSKNIDDCKAFYFFSILYRTSSGSTGSTVLSGWGTPKELQQHQRSSSSSRRVGNGGGTPPGSAPPLVSSSLAFNGYIDWPGF